MLLNSYLPLHSVSALRARVVTATIHSTFLSLLLLLLDEKARFFVDNDSFSDLAERGKSDDSVRT